MQEQNVKRFRGDFLSFLGLLAELTLVRPLCETRGYAIRRKS
jgi:hypothetical protein